MLSNRGRDTKPEMRLRRELHRLGFRYRVQVAPLADLRRRRADIVFTRAMVAVDVRGCFWHGCPQHRTSPKANADYWREKIDANVARDHDTEQRLRGAGWEIIVVWEHEDIHSAAHRVMKVVNERSGHRDAARRRQP